MRSFILLPLLTALGTVSCVPLHSNVQTERDICRGAINCESFFNNATGHHHMRFKRGMEPGSAWYKRHVEPYDPFAANENNIEVRTLSNDGTEVLDPFDAVEYSKQKRKNSGGPKRKGPKKGGPHGKHGGGDRHEPNDDRPGSDHRHGSGGRHGSGDRQGLDEQGKLIDSAVVSKASASEDSDDYKITTNLDKSSENLNWGDKNPGNTLNSVLSKQCYEDSCLADTSVTTDYFTNGVEAQGSLKMSLDGTYTSNKGYFIQAIVAIAKKLQTKTTKTRSVCDGGGDTGTSCHEITVPEYHSGSYFAVTRIVHLPGGETASSAHLTVTVSFAQKEDSDSCSAVVSALGGLMGATGTIGAIGGGFFGLLGETLCN